MMRHALFFGAVFVLLLWGCGDGGGSGGGGTPTQEIHHSGTVSSDETWDAQHIHIVDDNLYIENNATVTIEAGATVKVNQNVFIYVGYNSPGGLVAVGTAPKRITFTANTPHPSAGFWGGIYFAESAFPTSKLEFCDIEYAGDDSGWGEGDGGVLIQGSGATGPAIKVANCNIRYIGAPNSGAFGIVLAWGGHFAANSEGNTITNCDGYPIKIDAAFAHTLSLGSFTGNGIDRILVNTDSSSAYAVQTTCTWINPGVPYEITSNLYVEGPSNPVLTIEAGATLLFRSGYGLIVGYSSNGGLKAQGTPSAPITFSSVSASPSRGDWVGIFFHPDALACTLSYCVVEYGGADSGTSGYDGDDFHGDDGNIAILDNAYNKVTIEHCTIRESAGYGIIRGWSTSTHGAGPDYTSSSYYNDFSDNNWGDQSPPRS